MEFLLNIIIAKSDKKVNRKPGNIALEHISGKHSLRLLFVLHSAIGFAIMKKTK